MEKDGIIHIRVSKEEKAFWKEYARAHGLSMSELFRRAVEAYINSGPGRDSDVCRFSGEKLYRVVMRFKPGSEFQEELFEGTLGAMMEALRLGTVRSHRKNKLSIIIDEDND
jgi:hypothetical protein